MRLHAAAEVRSPRSSGASCCSTVAACPPAAFPGSARTPTRRGPAGRCAVAGQRRAASTSRRATTAAQQAATESARSPTAMRRRRRSRSGEVSTDGDSRHRGARLAAGRWGRRPGPTRPRCSLTKGETADGDAWLVRWSPAVVEPSLKTGERLVETTIKPERGDILGAERQADRRPRGPCSGSASTRARSRAGDRRGFRELARASCVDVDAKAFVKQVTAAGPEGVRAGDRLPAQRRAPPSVLGRPQRHPGARAISDRLPLAPTKDFAVRDPGHGRTGDRRAGQGQQGPDQGR